MRLVFIPLIIWLLPIFAEAETTASPSPTPCWKPYSMMPDPSKKCVTELKKNCEARGGRWGGTVLGRGRSPGCLEHLPDAGKPCAHPDDCKGGCVANLKPPPAYVCAEYEGLKGCGILMKTEKGVSEMCID